MFLEFRKKLRMFFGKLFQTKEFQKFIIASAEEKVLREVDAFLCRKESDYYNNPVKLKVYKEVHEVVYDLIPSADVYKYLYKEKNIADNKLWQKQQKKYNERKKQLKEMTGTQVALHLEAKPSFFFK